MRVRVLYDEKGSVIWAERLPRDGDCLLGAPLAVGSQRFATLFVPRELAHLDLISLFSTLRVNPRTATAQWAGARATS